MLLKNGDTNLNVTYLQYGLHIMDCNPGGFDGIFGDNTYNAVKRFQSLFNLDVDGIVGDATWSTLSSKIKSIQSQLTNKGFNIGTTDGIAGINTYNGIIEFQKANNLISNGIVNEDTKSKLFSDDEDVLPTLKLGDKGDYVKKLQLLLISKGYSIGSYGADGDFGQGTYNAVILYQKEHGLSTTGIVDNETWNSFHPIFDASTSLVTVSLINFVKSYEGFSSTPYYDSAGVKTIGYGSTNGPIMGKVSVTESEASEALLDEINTMASAIKSDLNNKDISLTQQEFDSLCSFAYNCGVSALLGSTLYKNICAGVNDESLRDNFKAWCHAGGKVLQGLLNRRDEECDMFLYGDYIRNK